MVSRRSRFCAEGECTWPQEEEHMRKLSLSVLIAFVFSVVASRVVVLSAQTASSDQYAGKWSGTWEGPGTGQFDLTLAKGKDGTPTGKVDVTSDGGNYSADLTSVKFDGNKIVAKYDFPLDPSAEVIVSGTFDDHEAKGTWAIKTKGQDAEVAAGTWTVTKK